MKFIYEFRTSTNDLKRGTICASDRDAAFQALKAQGIRPARLTDAPGFFNKLFGKGKRWIAIGVLALAAATFLLVHIDLRREVKGTVGMFDSQMRRQVIGDVAIVEEGIRTGWKDVFPHEGERFLASFAIPGVPAGVRTSKEAEIKEALARKIEATSNDTIEARQIKAIVEGLKNELREFIKDGGTIRQYGRRLVQRQEEEIGYYRRAQNELDNAVQKKLNRPALEALVERHNNALRRIGVKPLLLPVEEEK